MKKKVLSFLIFIVILFPLFVVKVNAQSSQFIEAVYLYVNDDSNNVRFSSALPDDTVYFDETKYYLKKDSAKQIVNYRVVVKFSEIGLNGFGGGINSVAKVKATYVVNDCVAVWGAHGKYEGKLPTSTFAVELGQNSTSGLNCTEQLLKKAGLITITITLTSSSGRETTTSQQYKLNLQNRPINKCELQIKTSKEGNPKYFFNSDLLQISGDNIDDGGSSQGNGFKVLLDGLNFPFCGSVNRKTDCYFQNGNSFNITETQLSVGEHTITVNQDKNNGIVLCTKKIIINQEGKASPIPAAISHITGSDDTEKTINLSVSTPTSLCDSVPDQFKSKCIACAGSGENAGIWTGLGCIPTDVTSLTKKIFNLFSGLLGLFIFYCIISNGFKVMISRDSADAMKKAQEAITSCIVGLLVLVFSVLFLRIVGVDILKIPGWS